MRAVVIDQYGGPEQLTLQNVPVPKPGAGQVLVRIHAASINPIDWKLRDGSVRLFYPIKMPAILGFDFAGEVAALGKGVTGWKMGAGVYTRLPTGKTGSYAEYVAVDADLLGPTPTSMSWDEAAAVPLAALTALQGMRDRGGLEAGQRVLINGASGGVGTFAVQVARALGADVTAVCSQRNAELVTELGAHRVIDYREEDFTAGEEPYDQVFDVVANASFGKCRPVIRPGGSYVTTLPTVSLMGWMVLGALTVPFGGRRARLIRVRPDAADLRTLTGWAVTA